jgi:lysophospholipase L1-like esterase
MLVAAKRSLAKFFAALGFGVCSLVVFAAVLEFASWAIWSVAQRSAFPQGSELQKISPAYQGESWAAEFWQEEPRRQKSHKVYVPFRVWGVTNWHGKYVNNDEGKTGIWRRTINPAPDKCKTRTVGIWTFGGSTMYGTGVPDWATLPSYLSRDLNAASSECVEVSNFGVEGYLTNQELILLMEQLKAGGHPDMVIFYDGLNDAGAAGPSSGPPKPHFYIETIKPRVEGTVGARFDFIRETYAFRIAKAMQGFFSRQHSSGSVLNELHTKAVATLDNYEANLRVAKALARAYNFRIYCFWQPSLYYGQKPLVPFEKQIPEIATRDPWALIVTAVYQEAESRAASTGEFIFLGGIFDSVKEPVYIDQGHLGPLGNELAAQAVAQYIQGHSENSVSPALHRSGSRQNKILGSTPLAAEARQEP